MDLNSLKLELISAVISCDDKDLLRQILDTLQEEGAAEKAKELRQHIKKSTPKKFDKEISRKGEMGKKDSLK